MSALQDDRKAVNIGAARAEQLVLREKNARRHPLFQLFSSEMRPVEVLSTTLSRFQEAQPFSAHSHETCANAGKLVQLVYSVWPTCHLLPCNSCTHAVREKSFFIRIQHLSSSQKSRRITFSASFISTEILPYAHTMA